MAEVIREVEERPISPDNYPKPLPGDPVRCQQCLVPLVIPRNQEDQLGLTCPSCLQVTPTTPEGGASFQAALQDYSLVEEVVAPATTLEEMAGIPGVDNPLRRATDYCIWHAERKLDVYCETCARLVCSQCSSKGSRHHKHKCESLEDAFQKYKETIAVSLEPMVKQVMAMKVALEKLEKLSREICDRNAATKDSIHATFKQLREVLDVRETKLVGQLDEMTRGKLESLAAQREHIEISLAQLKSCLRFIGESMKTGNERDTLMVKTSTIKQAKKLATNPLQPHILTPVTKVDIAFFAPPDLIGACHYYGQVVALTLPDPSQCYATGKGVKTGVIGEKSTVLLTFEGKRSKEPIKAWECVMVSDATGTRSGCTVERKGLSQYEVSYQPTIKGRHQLRIIVEGQHIRGSPFGVVVKSSIKMLRAPILAMNEMEGPWGVAVNQRWEVVVTEDGKHCVSVFSPSGERLRSFGTAGSGQGQFQHPRGVALDGEGNILVSDSANHRIQKFTAEGEFITAVGTEGSGSVQLSYPIDLAFNTCNKKFYVVDTNNHRVQVLNSDFTFSSSFGKKGCEKRQFKEPCGIACDSTGKVYVADRDNHRIQVFTAEGKFLRMFGRRGQEMGKLDLPCYITTDSNGMLYISEWGNDRVSVFTSEGQFVTAFGKWGEEKMKLKWPCGLAVDDIGVVYVCDGEKNRVQIF